MLSVLLAIGAALAAAGISGIIFSRNFVAIMLAVELIIISSIVITVSFINASTAAGAMLLISLWAIAAVEAIATVTLYAFMKARGSNFRVDKLNLLKW